MDGVYIPIIALISIALMFIFFSYFRNRNLAEVHKTIRASLDHGTTLTPELLERMNMTQGDSSVDLRKGIVILAIGFAALASGVITDYVIEFAAVATFPIFVGIAFIIIWKINNK